MTTFPPPAAARAGACDRQRFTIGRRGVFYREEATEPVPFALVDESSITLEDFAVRLIPSPRALWPLLAVAISVGCSSPTDTPTPQSTLGAAIRVQLDPETVSFSAPGETVQMTVTLFDSEGRATAGSRGFSWSIGNSTVASLGAWTRYQPGIRVTAMQAGSTQVRVVALVSTGPNLVDTSPILVSGPDPGVTRYTMGFEIEFLDLDGDSLITCLNACAFPPGADLKVTFDAEKAVHSVVVQNQAANVQIAYIDGGIFGDVTSAAAQAVTFTSALIDRAFERNVVILIRTDQGATFKLGNPVEPEWVIDGISFDAGIVR